MPLPRERTIAGNKEISSAFVDLKEPGQEFSTKGSFASRGHLTMFGNTFDCRDVLPFAMANDLLLTSSAWPECSQTPYNAQNSPPNPAKTIWPKMSIVPWL